MYLYNTVESNVQSRLVRRQNPSEIRDLSAKVTCMMAFKYLLSNTAGELQPPLQVRSLD